jgi:hypothetical protein
MTVWRFLRARQAADPTYALRVAWWSVVVAVPVAAVVGAVWVWLVAPGVLVILACMLLVIGLAEAWSWLTRGGAR